MPDRELLSGIFRCGTKIFSICEWSDLQVLLLCILIAKCPLDSHKNKNTTCQPSAFEV